MQENQMKAATSNAHFPVSPQDPFRNRMSSEIHKLRKMDSGQMMSSSKYGGSLKSHLTTSAMGTSSDEAHSRSNNSCSNIYLVTSSQPVLNKNHPNSEVVPNTKYPREILIEKSSQYLTGSPVIVQPSYDASVPHKKRNKNIRNVYFSTDKTHSRSNSRGSGYDSDLSDDSHFFQEPHTASSFGIHPSKYTPPPPTMVSKMTQKPSLVEMFPPHQVNYKNSSDGYKNAYHSARAKESAYPNFQSLDVNPQYILESLKSKQHQLDETTEQLRLAKEVVKELEEAAQMKTWQALKEQEVMLKEKEESLKYREKLAQKKYEEAIRLIDEFRKLSDCERMKDKHSVEMHMKVPVYEDSLLPNILLDKEQFHYFNSHEPNKDLSISQSPFSETEIRNIPFENQNQSDTSIGMERGHTFTKRTQTKPVSRGRGRKPNRNYFALNLSEVKPSIEPTKILRTYARKSTKKDSLQPKINLQSSGSPSYDNSQNVAICMQTNSMDIPVSSKRLTEQVFVNESGTITITPLPKFAHQPKPYSKQKSSRLYPVVAVSPPLKKHPSRIDTDSSPYSSSSDLSRSFAEKVEKLTSLTNLQCNNHSTQINKTLNNLVTKSEVAETVPVEQSIQSSIENAKYYVADKSLGLKVENTILKKAKKERLSMVTLEGISLPSHSDNTLESLDLPPSQLIPDPLNVKNYEQSADIECTSANISQIVANYENGKYGRNSHLIQTNNIRPEVLDSENNLSKIHSFNEIDSRTFSSPNCLIDNYNVKTLDSEPESTANEEIMQNIASLSKPLIAKFPPPPENLNFPTFIKTSLDSSTEDILKNKEMTFQEMPPIASQKCEQIMALPVTDQTYSFKRPVLSTESVYMLSDPSKVTGTIPNRYFAGSIQSIVMSPNKHVYSSVERRSSEGYDKTDAKETHLTLGSFGNASVQEILNPQAGSIPLTNQDITGYLGKLSDQNLQLPKVFKIQTGQEGFQPIPEKSIQCNEGVQINNIQNIIFDVKNINQTSFSLSPDKKSCINSSDVTILSPGINSLANNASPLIQFDPKLIHCILNNTDQTIYNPPTVVYTSPTQNMVNSFATTTVSSCPLPTLDEENSRISSLSSTTFQPKAIEDSNVTIDEKHDIVYEKFESHISDSEMHDVNDNIEESQNPSNPCKFEKPKAINDSPIQANLNKLPTEIGNISSKDPLLYDDNIEELNSSSSSSISDLVNDITFNQSKMTVDSKNEGNNVFPCVVDEDSFHSQEDSVPTPDTMKDADNESPNNSTETPNKVVGISSKGGRVLKLKEWWSDIVTESSKNSPKADTGNNSTLQVVDFEEESKKECPPLQKRKRGRPKLKRNKKPSFPKKVTNEASNKNLALFWSSVIFPSVDKACTSFECGKCSHVYDSEEKFRSHAFKIHGGLVRLKGEIQEFDRKTTNKILKIVFDEQKYLNCDGCTKEFKSILGFQYHRKICRRISQMWLICNQCGSSFMKNSSHLCVDDDLEITGKRKKRKAAQTCHTQMKMLYSNITTEKDASDQDFEYDSQFKQFFTQQLEYLNPNSPRLRKFNKDLETQGEGSCINLGCQMSFTCFSGLKKHLKNSCPANLYKCKKCCTLHHKDEINEHLEAKHTERLWSTEDSSEEDLDIEKRSYYSKYYEPIEEVTLEFREKNYSKKLFPKLTCHSSEWVEINDFNSYLHKSRLQFSPLFKIQNKTNTNSEENLWERLDTFSGKKAGLGAILFAGGPIRSAAWCPIPPTEKSVSQYIALASISNANEVYPVNKSVKHRGMLQIWDCGNLTKAEEPTLALAIAHEYGLAWSFDWCPSGIYEIPNNLPQGSLNRLGYISAAFSDGSIRLYMIPHPHQIKNKSRFFEKSPEFSLLPFNYQDLELQCLKVCWSTSKGHSLIAGSFTNGMVCIWDLNNMSSILNKKNENGHNILYPINSIHAHYGVCSSVSFCPRTDGQHIVTGGSDRAIKFWDLTQPEHPVAMVKKGMVTDTVWLPHWAGAFIANDDVYNPPKLSTTFRENGFYGGHYRPVLGSNATVWGIACSEWMSALAQVDDAGDVMVSQYGRLDCELANEKLISKRRYPIFTIHLQNLETRETLSLAEEYQSQISESSEQCSNSGNNKKDSNLNCNVKPWEFKEQPVSLSEAVGIYGLKIYDHEYTDFAVIKKAQLQNKQFSEVMEPGPLNIYPLMGASSVAWNNNSNSRFWIFVGLNSGLGRIIRLSFLHNQR